jgi:hypothetical protein
MTSFVQYCIMVCVRIDRKTGKGSALDVIRLINNTRSNHAAAHLRTILEKRPDLRLTKCRIDGKGRQTPVGTLECLMAIAKSCPTVRNTVVDPEKLMSVLEQVQADMETTSTHAYPGDSSACDHEEDMDYIVNDTKVKSSFGPLSCMISDEVRATDGRGSIEDVLLLLLGISCNEVEEVWTSFRQCHPDIVEDNGDGFASADALHRACEYSAVSCDRKAFVHKCIDRDVLGMDIQEECVKQKVQRSMLEAQRAMESNGEEVESYEAASKCRSPTVRKALKAYVSLKHLGLIPNMTQQEVAIKLRRSKRGRALLSFLSLE